MDMRHKSASLYLWKGWGNMDLLNQNQTEQTKSTKREKIVIGLLVISIMLTVLIIILNWIEVLI